VGGEDFHAVEKASFAQKQLKWLFGFAERPFLPFPQILHRLGFFGLTSVLFALIKGDPRSSRGRQISGVLSDFS
jgi:hypothetical protein